MKVKVVFGLALLICLSLAMPAFAADEHEIQPLLYECPASGDGRHHYNVDDREFHVRIGVTDRCEVFRSTCRTCTACGDVYVTPKYDIREHEFASARCLDAGEFCSPPWDC